MADALGVEVDEGSWPSFVEAATLDAMRSRAAATAPNADEGMWRSPAAFFRVGGTREWAALLDGTDLEHLDRRLRDLAGDASGWVLRGRAAFG